MLYYEVPGTQMKVSAMVWGCMHLTDVTPKQGGDMFRAALECGVNYFDHADCYAAGACESRFAEVAGLTPSLREKIYIQSKCGIRSSQPGGRPAYFDFSKEHILASVDGSLQRLGTEYLDVLLLHRPDALMEPDEVGEAFERLQSSGKVRHFGVSNQSPAQMALLQSGLQQPLLFNQLQFSVAHTPLLDAGLHVNMGDAAAVERSGGALEYCRLHGITLQAWSPFQRGFFQGAYLGDRVHYAALNDLLDELAHSHGVSPTAIATAWILRHPARMQVLLGTMNEAHLREACQGTDVHLTRAEWYALYRAAGNVLP